MECRICGKDCKESLTTWDFMANREPFEYFICDGCGTWQIETIPEDIGKYYSKDYYSYDSQETRASITHFRNVAKIIIDDFKLIESTSILDYGAGSIGLLKGFYNEGVGEVGHLYKLRAYDKYAPECQWNGIKLQNKLPTDLKFDFILSKHCIEHETDPARQIIDILNLLSPQGIANFVAPNPDSINARYFRGHWIGIDGPRHLNVMTKETFADMVTKLGGEVVKSDTIGEASDYLTSEAYKLGKNWKDRDKYINGLSNERISEVYGFSKVCEDIGQGDMWSVTIKRSK